LNQTFPLPTLLRNLANLIEANDGHMPDQYMELFSNQTPKSQAIQTKRKPIKKKMDKQLNKDLNEIINNAFY